MNRVYFLHIEKTAGTTLHDIFRNNSFFHFVVSPYKFSKSIDNQNQHLTADELHKLKKYLPPFKSFGGHNIRSFEPYEQGLGDNLFGITFLRDPVSRYMSHYYHQINTMHINWSMDEFLAHPHLNNIMCKRVCGEENAEKSIQLLEAENMFVGCMENFDASLVLLKEFLEKAQVYKNFDIRYEQKNTAKQKPDPLLINQYQSRILSNNAEDIKLFKYFSAKLQTEINNSNLSAQIKTLNHQNLNFKFNAFKINRSKLIRKLYQIYLERYLRDTSVLKL